MLLIPSTTVVIAVLMPFHTVVATLFMALNTVVTMVFTAFTTVVTCVLIAFQTVVKTVFIAFITVLTTVDIALIAPDTFSLIASQTAIMISLQFSQMNLNGRVMISNAASRIAAINIIAVWTVFLMPSHRPVKKSTIPVQRFTKKSLIPVHTSFQLVPNHPSTTSATPRSTFMMLVKELTMKFQMDKKMPFTPSHTCDQLPVKIPIKISRIPVMIPSVSSSTFAIYVNTPSNTGARKSHRPFHIADTTSPKFSKSNPSALSLSVIPCANPEKMLLIRSQIAIILFRNSSLVFQR